MKLGVDFSMYRSEHEEDDDDNNDDFAVQNVKPVQADVWGDDYFEVCFISLNYFFI